jgi:hypothetical protein
MSWLPIQDKRQNLFRSLRVALGGQEAKAPAQLLPEPIGHGAKLAPAAGSGTARDQGRARSATGGLASVRDTGSPPAQSDLRGEGSYPFSRRPYGR